MANYKVRSKLLSLMCLGIFVMAIVPVVQAQDWGWPEQVKLTASDGTTNDYFGNSVSIIGNYAIVGAYGGDDNGGNRSGSAYVFKKSEIPGDPNWYELSKLSASNLEAVDSFGKMVSINANTGTVLMI